MRMSFFLSIFAVAKQSCINPLIFTLMKKLNIMATIKDGLSIALVNYLSLIITVVLYLLTIWIPYLNVGTTIAMESLPAEMAKGKMINPLFIFDGKFRKNMGEFFILMSLMSGAIAVGFMFMFVPGIVISIAWAFAAVLFVDKDMSALDCLRESNRLTYGNKWRIFGAEFLLAFAIGILAAIIAGLFGIGHIKWLEVIGSIINIILLVFFVPAIYGVEASIYRQLTSGEFLEAEECACSKAEEPAPAAAEPAPAAAAEVKKPAAKKPAAKKPAKKE